MKDLEENIRSKVQGLLAEPEYSCYEIQVGVENGIVHLAGSVPDQTMRDQIEFEIGKISGVRGIANRISAPGSPLPGRTIDLNLCGKES